MKSLRFLVQHIQQHGVKTPLFLAGLSLVLTSLAAFMPASSSPTVWVASDATSAMHCATRTTLHANTPRAVTTATQSCPAGTILQLQATTERVAIAKHQAYVTAPDGAAARALLHPTSTPAAGKHPAVICLASAACGGGGGGGGSPCDQQSRWISYNTGNVQIQGWYSSYGTSDCQAFEVYSEGLEQTWSRPLWAWFVWHTVWQSDNGYSLNNTVPTSYYLTRYPYYWVGAGGAREYFYENNGFATNYWSLQFTPR